MVIRGYAVKDEHDTDSLSAEFNRGTQDIVRAFDLPKLCSPGSGSSKPD